MILALVTESSANSLVSTPLALICKVSVAISKVEPSTLTLNTPEENPNPAPAEVASNLISLPTLVNPKDAVVASNSLVVQEDAPNKYNTLVSSSALTKVPVVGAVNAQELPFHSAIALS